MIGSSQAAQQIADYKQQLNDCYSLTNLGLIHWLLGIKITCNCKARTISLSQTLYIDTILSCFSLSEAKSVATPITPGANLTKEDAPSDETEAT